MPSSSPPAVPQTLKKEHMYYCFEVIQAEIKGQDAPAASAMPDADESFPLFVTWNIYSKTPGVGTPRLRGCIGTFSPVPLREGLADYASISAFKDHRFNPISSSELVRLQCAVSLLTNFEECSDYLDWEIGTHGIYIDFDPPALAAAARAGARAANGRSNGRSRLSATYLPDVMPEQGWSKQEAIDSAIGKAGWRGPITEDLRRSLHVRRYRSEKDAVNYKEWQEARAE